VTNVEESQVSQDFRRSIFGHLSGGETMPPAFLSQLQHLVDGAGATLGIRRSGTERVAYWLTGRVLGFVACTGSYDADADISGWVLRLDDVAQIDIDVNVVIDHPGPWGDGHKGALLPHNIKTSIECRLGGEPSKARTVAERSN
jgi:hypothetical protein